MSFNYERQLGDKTFYVRGTTTIRNFGIYILIYDNEVEVKIGFLFFTLLLGIFEKPELPF